MRKISIDCVDGSSIDTEASEIWIDGEIFDLDRIERITVRR